MFLAGLVIGICVGAALMGEVAHRKPEWFAKVVKVANTAVDAAKAKIEG